MDFLAWVEESEEIFGDSEVGEETETYENPDTIAVTLDKELAKVVIMILDREVGFVGEFDDSLEEFIRRIEKALKESGGK